jgi:hypothetical protein
MNKRITLKMAVEQALPSWVDHHVNQLAPLEMPNVFSNYIKHDVEEFTPNQVRVLEILADHGVELPNELYDCVITWGRIQDLMNLCRMGLQHPSVNYQNFMATEVGMNVLTKLGMYPINLMGLKVREVFELLSLHALS